MITKRHRFRQVASMLLVKTVISKRSCTMSMTENSDNAGGADNPQASAIDSIEALWQRLLETKVGFETSAQEALKASQKSYEEAYRRYMEAVSGLMTDVQKSYQDAY